MGYRSRGYRYRYRKASEQRPPIPMKLRQRVFTEGNNTCALCGSRFNLEIDHIQPHSLGGGDSVHNLQILCAECNRGKATLTRPSSPYDFR
jgi:5-methylcytosine-specific restriction protein A